MKGERALGGKDFNEFSRITSKLTFIYKKFLTTGINADLVKLLKNRTFFEKLFIR